VPSIYSKFGLFFALVNAEVILKSKKSKIKVTGKEIEKSAHIFVKSGSIYIKPTKMVVGHHTHRPPMYVKYISPAEIFAIFIFEDRFFALKRAELSAFIGPFPPPSFHVSSS